MPRSAVLTVFRHVDRATVIAGRPAFPLKAGEPELFNTNEKRYIAKYINEADTWVGIDESVYEIITQSQGNPRILERLPSVLAEHHERSTYSSRDYSHRYQVTDEGDDSNPVVGEDGIYIQLGKAWLSRQQKNQQSYR